MKQIYIIEDGCGNKKIGMTRNIKQRVNQLKTAIPNGVVSVITSDFMENYREIEKQLHDANNAYRLSGEWFSDVVDFCDIQFKQMESVIIIQNSLENPIITKSRRGVLRHSTNPSIGEVYNTTKKRTRRIGNRYNKNSTFIVSNNGNVLASAQSYGVEEVDKKQLIKLYIQSVKALQDLSSAGTKVVELLDCEMQKKPSADKIYLHYATVQESGNVMSLATFKRGMSELINKEFLYECVEPSNYFVNINYMFNGDRLAFVKEYRLKTTREVDSNPPDIAINEDDIPY